MNRPSATESAFLGTNPEVVFGDVDGQIVALNMKSGQYLHLNSTGTFIFNVLQAGPQTLERLLGRVEEEYDVEPTLCRTEVGAFVERCIRLDLLRVGDVERDSSVVRDRQMERR